MTTALLAATAGATLAGGLVGLGWWWTPTAAPLARPRRTPGLVCRLQAVPPKTVWSVLVGLAIGVGVAVFTGWFVAIVAVPLAVAGIPVLLAPPAHTKQIDRLEAMAEWTRNLAGVLTVGVGLEQALTATLRSTPEAIKPEVSGLVARLRARWATPDALYWFADELDDATGDLVASYLILGARRRGAGLASVLQGLAESVAEDVTARRKIEADRAKPRATARNITLITMVALTLFAFNTNFMAPYATGLGQLLLTVMLSVYVAVLVWLRHMSAGKPVPRFLGQPAQHRLGGRP